MKTNPCKTIGSAVDKSSNLIQKKIILMGTEFILESTLHVKESIIELFSSDTNKMETKNKARIWGKSNENDFVMFDISSGGKMYFKDLCLVNDADKITGAGISKIISLSKEGEEVWIESCDILGESTKGKVLSTILLHILCGALKMYYVNVRFDGGDTTRPAIVCEERVNYVRWSYGSTTAVSKKGDIEQRGSGIFVDGRKAESSMFIYLSDVIFDSCFTSESDCGGAVTLFITERARLVFLESLKFNNCGSIDRAKGKGGALYVSLEEFSSSDFPVLFYLISFEGCSAAIGKNLAIQNEKGMNGINSDLIKMDFEELYHKENLFVVIDGARKTHDLLTGPDALPYSSRKIYLSSDKGVDQNECGMKEWECKTIEYGIHKLFESGLNECFLILEADAELSAKCTFVNRMTLQPYDAAERKTIKVTKFSDETENEAFAIETTGRMQHLNIKYLREIFSSLTTLIRITGKSFAMEDVCISLFGEAEQPLSVTLLFASNANIQLNNCQFVGMKQETNEDARIGQFVENKNKHFAENTKLKSRNNSHRNEDECSWSDSMVDLHSSNADLNNVTIERSYKYGGLSIINNCSVTISEGTFRENGADAVPYPSFPSIRRNIMCSNNYMQLSTIELDSLKPDSDGMKEGTMLWLSMTNSSNCLAMGNAARSLPSLYFMPSVDSVEAKEVENRLHVAVNGKLLLPCDTFVSYVEHNKKSSEEHYVYDLTQESEDKINFFVDLNNFYAPYITVRFYYSSNNEHHFIEASVPWNNTRKASPEEPTKTFNLTLVVVISVCGSAIGAVIIAASIIYYKKHKKRKSNYQPINDTNASIVQTYIPQSEVPTRQQYQATPSETPESLYY
ncbi:uncharacterized protein MONOS_2575 [Monocercomonoides exilis]|uniref:uncharacterized protein n=1 Tax=Monocercomonoides exilis TaxID=2049356 RepID=UPI00355A6726|nr:hypothetical protein MONOS_2575 [Monocercomonoides exilis]|eukprot:MONOS_2575.1-p1 / transcript=MONOS_2575.1 / gene=MONOS_2575 / organism=Monocercomonoides_exilis_PA203 / gene_product=unspecified product / transcript_product=unspecified product / location=Mono_scaffold00054:22196-24754(-) / protein_length=853 / sequence_SO=supercontig / SO=protein_coding / is_pseudo=false